MRDETFSTKPLYTPLLFMENLYIRNYSKYRCVPLRFLSALWKKIKGEKWYPLLMHKFFYTRKDLKYTRDPLGLFSVLWDKKKLDENVNTLPATDILCTKLFDTWVFLNQRTAPIWLITALWDRISGTENRVTAHLCLKKSVPQIFWYIEGFPTKTFGTVRQ